MKDYTNDVIAQMTSGSRSFIYDGKGSYAGEIKRYGNDNRTFVYGKNGGLQSIIRTERSVMDLFPDFKN